MSSITVDTNPGENDLFERIKARAAPGAEVLRARLDVGDVLVRAPGCVLVIERKTVADLVSSIEDGRSREQKARQLAAVAQDESGATRVVWVVEGQLSGWHAQLPPPRCFPNHQMEAAVACTAVRDGIPVLRCRDGESVAEMILYLFSKAAAGDLDGVAEAQKRAAAGYSGCVQVKKARNASPELTFQMMLSTIPGVSMSKAKAIADAYPTVTALVTAIRDSGGAKAAVKQVSSIEVGKKKLGPVVAGRIIEIFSSQKKQ